MRILILASLEGASGVRGPVEADWDTNDYLQARRWLTGDINAAVEGAMAAGATAFVVHDCCGLGHGNVLLDELHPAVEVIRRRPAILYEEADLARSYEGAFLIGMPSWGGPGISGFLGLGMQVRLNGRPVGESEIAVALAAAYSIPTLLITGDDRVCLNLQRWSGSQIEAAIVKYSLSRSAVRCLPLIEAQERIRLAAQRAVEGRDRSQLLVLPAPLTLEIELGREAARALSWLPQVGHDGERTVRYTDNDFRRIYRVLLAMLWMATSRLNPDTWSVA